MESDPVAHMVGVVATEVSDVPVWFEIAGTTPPPPRDLCPCAVQCSIYQSLLVLWELRLKQDGCSIRLKSG